MAQEIQITGGRLIMDYGSYRLYEATNLPAQLPPSSGLELRDDYRTIFLHAGTIDTRKPSAPTPPATVTNFNGRQLYLVQFIGPILPPWREKLLATGAQIVSYIPENCYLIYGDRTVLTQVQNLAATNAYFQWHGRFENSYRIHPLAQNRTAAGVARAIGTDLFSIQLVADAAANVSTVALLDRLKLEPFQRYESVLQYVNLVVRLDASELAVIAEQPDVISILPYFQRRKLCERQDQIIAGNISNNVPSGPGYLAWLASKGFAAGQFTNFSVDVSDSGIDNGTTNPAHFGLYAGGTNSNPGRVNYSRLEGTPNSGSTLQGCDGHGTINAHIIAGYDNFPGFPFADANGFHYGLGVCPFITVGASVIFDPDNYTFPNFANLQSQAYHGGARISNNSWGSASSGLYDSEAQAYDALVRDAQPTNSTYSTAGNQGMVIVFSAGNDGPTAQTINVPATGKNIITVGAADGVQAFGSADGSGIGDDQADNANDVTSFSSFGPCADGRIKPDLVAPGTHISGGVDQSAYDFADYPDGNAASCYTGDGVSGGPGGSFWPAGQQFYTASSGTSQAAPCVAGGCALIMQYFLNNFTNLPSPAMTKAYLLNSTRYLTGSNANDTLPSPAQGYGEMNLGMAFDGSARFFRDQLAADTFTASGQLRTFNGVIANSNRPLRVTLAWTDAPGSTAGNAYNNNLDLTLTLGTNVYKGNVFSNALSVTGGIADAKNNVESIFLPPGYAGPFCLTVSGTGINSIGVPNASNGLCQDFALVAANAYFIPTPNLLPAGSTLTAENCYPTNGVIDPGEQVTVNFTVQNSGTGATTNLVATLLTNNFLFMPSGPVDYGVIPIGGSATGAFTFIAGGVCGSNLTAVLQLTDGELITNVTFTLPLGMFTVATNFSQNFDGVTAPGLPPGWTTAYSGGESAWVTKTNSRDTIPNAAFVNEASSAGLSELVSPAISVFGTNAQLYFHNNYNLQATAHSTNAYDGAVLEIQIGNGDYADILDAGGLFLVNGYNHLISSDYENPLAGRLAWSGSSTGFVTTIVRLPATAAGQTIHFKWRIGTDDATNGAGWYIDSVYLVDGKFTCCNDTADLAVAQTSSPVPVFSGSNLNYTLSVTNYGPITATNLLVNDQFAANAALVSVSPGAMTNSNLATLAWTIPLLASGSGTNFYLTIHLPNAGSYTNIFAAASFTYDSYPANNTSTAITTTYSPVTLLTAPSNQVVFVGTNVLFSITVTGDAPLAYQWRFNGAILSAATNATLLLTNVSASQAGAYTITVSNLANGISATAYLSISLPPLTLIYDGSTATISLTSISSLNYTLQYKDDLNSPVWNNILPSQPGNDGILYLADPNPSTTNRFYRVIAN